MTGADTHFESFTGLDSADPVLSEEAAMQEGVAGTIGEFDKELFAEVGDGMKG